MQHPPARFFAAFAVLVLWTWVCSETEASAADPVPGTSSTFDSLLAAPLRPPRVIGGWDEAITMVRARSTDLKSALADAERASGESRVALAGVLPHVEATGQLTQNIVNKYAPGTPVCDGLVGTCSSTVTNYALPRTYLDGALQVVQPIIDANAWRAIGTASDAERVAKLDIDSLKRKIVLDVASAIVAVVTAEHVADLARDGLRTSIERFALADQRRVVGGGTRLDGLRARADVDVARADVLAADDSLKRAREALGLVLGVGGEVGVTPDISLDVLESSTRGACKPTSLEGRADVIAARGRLALAERRTTDAEWAFAPKLVGQSLIAASSLDVEPNPVWNVQGVLSFSLWDGGARYGAMRMAHADADKAEQALVAARLGASAELARARRAVELAQARRALDADARAVAVESDELTQTAFRTGQGTSLEVVIAAAARRKAEIDVALADFELVDARLAELVARATCTF